MDWLKEIVGEDLFKKIEEYLGDKKIILNDGSYIPREKFNAVNEQVKDLKTQLGERDEQLATLKKQVKDNTELTTQIEKLQEENKKVKEESETKIKGQHFDFSLEL